MEKVFRGQYHVTTSAVVPVEVCGSISRRAGVGRAVSAQGLINRWEEMNFFTYSELMGRRREEAGWLPLVPPGAGPRIAPS